MQARRSSYCSSILCGGNSGRKAATKQIERKVQAVVMRLDLPLKLAVPIHVILEAQRHEASTAYEP